MPATGVQSWWRDLFFELAEQDSSCEIFVPHKFTGDAKADLEDSKVAPQLLSSRRSLFGSGDSETDDGGSFLESSKRPLSPRSFVATRDKALKFSKNGRNFAILGEHVRCYLIVKPPVDLLRRVYSPEEQEEEKARLIAMGLYREGEDSGEGEEEKSKRLEQEENEKRQRMKDVWIRLLSSIRVSSRWKAKQGCHSNNFSHLHERDEGFAGTAQSDIVPRDHSFSYSQTDDRISMDLSDTASTTSALTTPHTGRTQRRETFQSDLRSSSPSLASIAETGRRESLSSVVATAGAKDRGSVGAKSRASSKGVGIIRDMLAPFQKKEKQKLTQKSKDRENGVSSLSSHPSVESGESMDTLQSQNMDAAIERERDRDFSIPEVSFEELLKEVERSEAKRAKARRNSLTSIERSASRSSLRLNRNRSDAIADWDEEGLETGANPRLSPCLSTPNRRIPGLGQKNIHFQTPIVSHLPSKSGTEVPFSAATDGGRRRGVAVGEEESKDWKTARGQWLKDGSQRLLQPLPRMSLKDTNTRISLLPSTCDTSADHLVEARRGAAEDAVSYLPPSALDDSAFALPVVLPAVAFEGDTTLHVPFLAPTTTVKKALQTPTTLPTMEMSLVGPSFEPLRDRLQKDSDAEGGRGSTVSNERGKKDSLATSFDLLEMVFQQSQRGGIMRPVLNVSARFPVVDPLRLSIDSHVLDDGVLISVQVEHVVWSARGALSFSEVDAAKDDERTSSSLLSVEDLVVDLETYEGSLLYGSGDSRVIEVVRVEDGESLPVRLGEGEEQSFCFRVLPRDPELVDGGRKSSHEAVLRAIRASVPLVTVAFSIDDVCQSVLRSAAGEAKYAFQQDLEVGFTVGSKIRKGETFAAQLTVEVSKGTERVGSHLDLYLVSLHRGETLPSPESFSPENVMFAEWERTAEDAEFGRFDAFVPDSQGVLCLDRIVRVGTLRTSEKGRFTVNFLALREGLQEVKDLYFFDRVSRSFLSLPKAPIVEVG